MKVWVKGTSLSCWSEGVARTEAGQQTVGGTYGSAGRVETLEGGG
jgi:hypothetical protein